ncbi:MAG: hypothetical protein L6Q92_14565 [Phycisphaerae bacterium]|nr:hypothetical protein [Phycisphaerae bacterium]
MRGFARLVAIISAVLDPILGLMSTLPGTVFGPGPTQRWDSPRRRRRGLVIIVGGIEGPSLYARAMAIGLLRYGWRGAIVVSRWNAGVPWLRAFVNLMSSAHHTRCAHALAAQIAEYRRGHPDGYIAIIAQSGGCWITIRALERMEDSIRVDRAVLLAPAVSSGYDVARAAQRCRGGLMSVGGPGDLFYLGLGTLALGTSDRRFRPAAGLLGWQHHPPGFVDARWRPEWLRHGYLGSHITVCYPRFIRAVIAPWLVGDAART